MKKCIICEKEQLVSDYYKHPQMPDGHLNKCKECCKKQSAERLARKLQDPDFVEKERQRHREKYHRLEYREKHKPSPEAKKAIIQRYNEKFPEKRAARLLCQRIKPVVEGNELHHWSYRPEHAKDLIELSVENHNTAHRYIVYDQEQMMYRTVDGVLLDSKADHFDYISKFFK